MSKYSLILSGYIVRPTQIKVYELCKNDVSLFDDFFKQIVLDGNLIKELATAIRIIEDTSNLQLRPQSKFRPLLNINNSFKVFEAKSGSIRIYLFHEEKKGRVIIAGGKKSEQDEDIRYIKNILKDYENELKP